MAFFPRIVANEFAPMFRLMEDYANHVSTRPNGYSQSTTKSYRSFTPKFDVKEEKDRYILEGELPGIAQQDVNIEFTDATTLSIKGRTETVSEQGSHPEVTTTEATIDDDKADSVVSDDSTSYHKATVEDETSAVSEAETATPAPEAQVATAPESQAPTAPQAKYWISERSVGEFARSFSFPSRVDHENVRASLKNGILSVIVPKAPAPVNRRVIIE